MAVEPSTFWQLTQDLTCSICLQSFENPVTIPCGHSYCQDCLAKAWAQTDDSGGFRCPQCRNPFLEKPALKRSTSLHNILTRLKGNAPLEDKMLQPGDIPCDICQTYKASETCLTCIASYCKVHLKPHIENPVFKDHLRTNPLRDLQERKCQDHTKLLEFYCKEHSKCLCCVCLASHNSCQYWTMEEERQQKETNLREQLTILDGQIQEAAKAIGSIKQQQESIKELASKTKTCLGKAFEEIKLLVEQEEAKVMGYVDEEETRLQEQVQKTLDRFTRAHDDLNKTKEQISQHLLAANSMIIFQKTTGIKLTTADHLSIPMMEMDLGKLEGICDTVPLTKNLIKNQICRLFKEKLLPVDYPEVNEKKAPLKLSPQKERRSLFKSRHECLQYASKLTLDINTAHQRICLSERFSKVSLTDTPQLYHDNPERFSDCFQVLSMQEFSSGCHYWEVNMSKSYCSIGIAYKSIKRSGLGSFLGRNTSSWCVEWFNLKMSAWHADNEIPLSNPNATCTTVGVFLNYDDGSVLFYSVDGTMTLLHEYQAHFTEPVCLAIAVFSSATTLTLSDLC